MAIELHNRIGGARKYAQLKMLRDYWVDLARALSGVEVTLPPEKDNYAAISAFRLPGMKSIEQARRAHAVLLKKYRLLVVAKAGMDMHGEPTQGKPDEFSSYWKQKDLTEAQGQFTAPFDGTHGWYWRNGGETAVTINLETTGFYRDLFQPPSE